MTKPGNPNQTALLKSFDAFLAEKREVSGDTLCHDAKIDNVAQSQREDRLSFCRFFFMPRISAELNQTRMPKCPNEDSDPSSFFIWAFVIDSDFGFGHSYF